MTTWGTVYRVRTWRFASLNYIYRGTTQNNYDTANNLYTEICNQEPHGDHELVTWVKYPARPGVQPRAGNTTIHVVRSS